MWFQFDIQITNACIKNTMFHHVPLLCSSLVQSIFSRQGCLMRENRYQANPKFLTFENVTVLCITSLLKISVFDKPQTATVNCSRGRAVLCSKQLTAAVTLFLVGSWCENTLFSKSCINLSLPLIFRKVKGSGLEVKVIIYMQQYDSVYVKISMQ